MEFHGAGHLNRAQVWLTCGWELSGLGIQEGPPHFCGQCDTSRARGQATGSAQVPGVTARSHRQRSRTSSVHVITSYFCFDDPLGNGLRIDYFHITHMRRLYYLRIHFWGHRGNSAKHLCSIEPRTPDLRGLGSTFSWEIRGRPGHVYPQAPFP